MAVCELLFQTLKCKLGILETDFLGSWQRVRCLERRAYGSRAKADSDDAAAGYLV